MAEKYLRVTMPDGSRWDVPARFIAEDRARYYANLDIKRGDATDFDQAFASEVEHALDRHSTYEIEDWASNNMDWADVKDVAVQTVPPPPPTEVNYQAGWNNHETWEIVER